MQSNLLCFADDSSLDWNQLLGLAPTDDKTYAGTIRHASDLGGYVNIFANNFTPSSAFDTQAVIRTNGVSAREVRNDRVVALDGPDLIETGLGNDYLDGGAGDDLLYGGAGNDIYVFGRSYGHDRIVESFLRGIAPLGEVTPDSDPLDTIRFDNSVDPSDISVIQQDPNVPFVYGIGNGLTFRINGTDDTITTESLTTVERVEFSDGTQWDYNTIRAMSLLGSDGDDTLTGFQSDDTLDGFDGNDTLNGNGGNDTLIGGPGNDQLVGGPGDDVYIFNPADGLDVITDSGGQDEIRFGFGIAPLDVTVTKQGSLNIGIGSGGDRIFVNNWLPLDSSGNTTTIVKITFADGTVWDASTIYAQYLATSLITGTPGNDALTGTFSDEIFNGGAGDDVLIGGGGSDLYRFGLGDGHDTIFDSSGGSGTIELGAGITANDIHPVENGDDLVIGIGNGGDQITIHDAFVSGGVSLITLTGGSQFLIDVLKSRVDTSGISGTPGDDVLTPDLFADSILYGLEGNDVLQGSLGSDVLIGGLGDDTLIGTQSSFFTTALPNNDIYYFNLGDGNDHVTGLPTPPQRNGFQSIVFGNGITPLDLQLSGTANNEYEYTVPNPDGGPVATLTYLHADFGLKLSYSSEDSISFDLSQPDQIESYNFADGTGWSQSIFDPTTLGESDLAQLLPIDNVFFTEGTGLTLAQVLQVAGRNYWSYSASPFVSFPFTATGWTRGQGQFQFFNPPPSYLLRSFNDLELSHHNFIEYSYTSNFRSLRDVEGAYLAGAEPGLTLGNYDNRLYDPNSLFAFGPPALNLFGTVGNDVVEGWESNDSLAGLEGDDTLIGDAGDDVLYGGTGNDILEGRSGDDTYDFFVGDGIDHISDNEGTNTLILVDSDGNGIPLDSLSLDLGSLLIHLGNNGDAIHIDDFNPQDVYASPSISNFYVGSGYVTYADVIARGFDLVGTSGNDVITGTNVDDRVHGMAGDDIIQTGDGNDLLDGGSGNDTLIGGAGNDVYAFGAGSGGDTIDETGSASDDIDTISLATQRNMITVARRDTDLVITLRDTGETLTLRDFESASNRISSVTFSDGLMWGAATLAAAADPPDSPPVLQEALIDQTAIRGQLFEFDVPAFAFFDSDPGDVLSYSATNEDGSALPDWLTFDANSRNFVGTPGAGDLGDVRLKVTASDHSNATTSGAFGLNVIALNSPPIVINPVAHQSAVANKLFTLQFAANTFTDTDFQYGDALTYSATLADDSVLPDWLIFNGSSLTFSGTPMSVDVGTIMLKLTATDLAGASAGDLFDVSVSNASANQAPVLVSAISDQSSYEDAPFAFTIPANTFSDPDAGDTLTYVATRGDGSALPAWLNFDLVNQTFTGTPVNDDVGTLSLKVVATDTANASVFDLFDITVNNTNDAPVANPDTSSVLENVTTANLVSTLLANDTDVDVSDTRTISAVNTTGTAGVVAFNQGAQLLTYAANGATLDALRAGVTATDTFTYTLTDAAGADSTATVTMTVTGVNDAPTASDDAVSVTENATTANLLPALLANDMDVDVGDTHTITAVNTAVTAGVVAFNASTQTLTYAANGATLDALRAGVTTTDTFSYTVTDGSGVNSTATVTMIVTGINDAPLANADAVGVLENVTTANLTATLLANDTDVDFGDMHNITAVNTTGTVGIVAFDAGTQALTYSANGATLDALRAGVMATDTFSYTVTDGSGVNSTATVTMTITGVNDAPVANADAVSVLENVATANLASTLLANDTDIDAGDTRSITSVNTIGTAGVVAFNTSTQTLTYTADGATLDALRGGVTTTDTFAYTVTDGSGATSTATVTMTVTGINDAPTLVTPIADQVATQNTAFNFTAPLNTITDVDVGDTLTYAATLSNGAALPAWLVFDTTNRTFSGTPGTSDAGIFSIKLVATDTGNLSVSDLFNIAIGTSGALNLMGTPNSDVLNGGAGNDTLNGLGNADFLNGNGGDDKFIYYADGVWTSSYVARNDGGPGYPGTGKTAAIAGKNRSFDVFNGGDGFDVLTGTSSDDAIFLDDRYSALPGAVRVPRLSGIERIEGGAGNDVIDLTSIDYAYGNVTLDGGDGNDVLWASSGDDVLLGGLGNDDLYGGAGNDHLDGGPGADTMVGGVGDDLYIVDDAGDVITEGASAGIDTVQSSISYTLVANVEKLVLTGANAINGTGNALANLITGNSSNNVLNGMAGADTMIGGTGDDLYIVDNAGDVVTELSDEGIDTVQSSINYALAANVENLVLIGTAGLSGTGNALDNALTGNSGANVLDAGVGADTMTGGAGNDTYIVDNIGDVVVELADQGTDTVQSSISYALPANVEKLMLIGSANIDGTGNGSNNTLTGNSGNNVLDGGAGADTMSGGVGDDTYVIDNTGDLVTESANAGTDTVRSSITYTLGANVESLTLTGATAINGTGNSLNNVMIGNSAANTLTGGAGADTMMGGNGDDTYIVDNAADVVNENPGEGFDIIQSSVTRTISDNVERLTLTGSAAINATGNNDDNVLTGNAANNVLTGGAGNDLLNGGAGADTMIGDTGNDVLEGMDGNDILTDSGGNNLFKGGVGTDTMTGNTGNDIFVGGAGNDLITTNIGSDIVAFNRGDGQDTLVASTGTDNTITFGGGIRYVDLTFTKSGNNLVLGLGGASEKMTLQNWYNGANNKSVLNLQVIAEAMIDFDANSADPLLNKKVQNFDFQGLVAAFDSAGDPNNWALTNQLLSKHLSGSDTDAIGGDLAYQYGRNGTLAGIGFDPAIAVMSSASFGSAAQTLQPLQDLQQGPKRLS